MGSCQSSKSSISPEEKTKHIILNLLPSPFSEALSIDDENQRFLTQKYTSNPEEFITWLALLKEVRAQSQCFNENHLKSILYALRYDELITDAYIEIFNQWLNNNEQAIYIASQVITHDGRLHIADQSNQLVAMHHTTAHGIEVCTRASYLCNKLNLSAQNSPTDNAYRALRTLMIEMHDLIQTAPFGSTSTNKMILLFMPC